MTEAKQQLPENKMGTMPVGKLIFFDVGSDDDFDDRPGTL